MHLFFLFWTPPSLVDGGLVTGIIINKGQMVIRELENLRIKELRQKTISTILNPQFLILLFYAKRFQAIDNALKVYLQSTIYSVKSDSNFISHVSTP